MNSTTADHLESQALPFAETQSRFRDYVLPSYSRFDLVLDHGRGSFVWDIRGKRYLDLGGGIAVCSLGHAHPELAEALAEQAHRLVHCSNLYYHPSQGQLAEALVQRIGPGKCFFANSGAEANEGLYKLTRRFGYQEGRFEILTCTQSFHGRTLAGIAATGQQKVKDGFEPMVPGFRQVPFDDLEALQQALSPATAAVLVEAIQGEGGIVQASPDYLLGLRRFCTEKNLLLLMDEIQCGQYRTGPYLGYQRLLEGSSGGKDFLPDAISMAKGLGGGLPIGAFWVREPYAHLLGPGSHASTFGGNPLVCAAALKVLDIIRRDQLDLQVRRIGERLKSGLETLAHQFPQLIQSVRGVGFMLGLVLADSFPVKSDKGLAKAPSLELVALLQDAGLLTVPAGKRVVRLLPALNLDPQEAEEGLSIIESVLTALAS